MGFRAPPVFPFDSVNFLRCRTYEALLIRPPPIALRTSPEAKSPFLPIDFSEIHGRSIVGTSHSGNHVQLIGVSVLARHEVSARHAVVDETIGLRTGVGEYLCTVALAVREALIKFHLRMIGRYVPPQRFARFAGFNGHKLSLVIESTYRL
jgi:hypothetical protein